MRTADGMLARCWCLGGSVALGTGIVWQLGLVAASAVVAVVQRLRRVAGSLTTVACLGGDEFAVLLPYLADPALAHHGRAAGAIAVAVAVAAA